MLTLFEHPNYLYYYSSNEAKDEVLFVNFKEVLFDKEVIKIFFCDAFESIGIVKDVFIQTSKLATDVTGEYSLNKHIDLLYHYLVSRGINFESTLQNIVKIFFEVYQKSNRFIRDDIKQFIYRYTEILDIIFYGFSAEQFEKDMRFSSNLSEFVFSHLFLYKHNISHFINFQNRIVNELGYKKVFLMEPDSKIQREVDKKRTFQNFITIELPLKEESEYSEMKNIDSFDFITF